MKNFFKKAKKSMTLGVAKVKSGVTGDAKKRENEDPQFIEQTEKLRSLKSECIRIIKALNTLGSNIESLANVLEITGNTFGDVIHPDCNQYYQFSGKSQEGIHEYNKYMHNFSTYYLKNVVMKPLNDLDQELDNLNMIREKRKKNKVLLQQEEKHLKSAQEKNKDVDSHVEKTRLRREKYERYNNQFLTGVAMLYDKRAYVFGQAFDIYQFYLAELIELQERCIKQNLSTFPMETLRNQIQSCSTKPQLNLTSTTQSSSFGTNLSSDSQYSATSSTFSQQYQGPPSYHKSYQKQTQAPSPLASQQPPASQPPPASQSQTPIIVQNPDLVEIQNPEPVQHTPSQEENIQIPLNPYSASDPNLLPNKSSENLK